MIDPMQIPGMIEPVEAGMLQRLAKDAIASADIVEFGAFLGRSTACLANGAMAAGQRNGIVHTYDSFACVEGGSFAVFVDSFARIGNVHSLLENVGGRVNFCPVFDHYLRDHIDSGLLVRHVAELADSQPDGIRQISLLHVDSPKFYSDFTYVLRRFVPLMPVGGVIVFQDYFYHWSASLIAAVQVLRDRGFLEPLETAASSLACRLLKPVDQAAIDDLDRAMQDVAAVRAAIRAAASGDYGAAGVDRPQNFLPRVDLAALQYDWSLGDYRSAMQLFHALFFSGKPVQPSVAKDYLDMMNHGFDIRRAYEIDHNIQ